MRISDWSSDVCSSDLSLFDRLDCLLPLPVSEASAPLSQLAGLCLDRCPFLLQCACHTGPLRSGCSGYEPFDYMPGTTLREPCTETRTNAHPIRKTLLEIRTLRPPNRDRTGFV